MIFQFEPLLQERYPPVDQSYKGSAIVNYDSRVVSDYKLPYITTLEP